MAWLPPSSLPLRIFNLTGVHILCDFVYLLLDLCPFLLFWHFKFTTASPKGSELLHFPPCPLFNPDQDGISLIRNMALISWAWYQFLSISASPPYRCQIMIFSGHQIIRSKVAKSWYSVDIRLSEAKLKAFLWGQYETFILVNDKAHCFLVTLYYLLTRNS